MIIIFFDLTVVLFFALAAIGLGLQAWGAINGFIGGLAIFLFVVEAIGLAVMNIYHLFKPHNRTIVGIFKMLFALASSAVCLFISYLFLFDLGSYGDGFWDLINFILTIIFGGAIWLCQLGGAIATSCFIYTSFSEAFDDDFSLFTPILLQIVTAAIMYWLCR